MRRRTARGAARTPPGARPDARPDARPGAAGGTARGALATVLPPGEVDLVEGLAVRDLPGAPADAPRLLLVHGLGGATTSWALVAPALAREFRVRLVDLPGHGGSPQVPADAMHPAALGRRLLALAVASGAPASGAPASGAPASGAPASGAPGGGRPVHLVGHSLGGWVCLEAAAADARDGSRARAVASVTALAPAGLWTAARRRPPLLPTGQQFARGYVAARARLPFDPLATRLGRTLAFVATSAAPGALPVDLARDVVTSVAGASGYTAADAGIAAGAFTSGAAVDVPVVVVTGLRDRVLPPAHLLRAAAPPQATWLQWPDCGHVPAWDRPADCVALVREHVRSAEEAVDDGPGDGPNGGTSGAG